MSAAEANNRSNDASINDRAPDSHSHSHSHSFINNLKRFNIDPSSKYKHYGHQSLLNATAVESLMAGEPQSPSPHQEQPPASDSARIVIDESLSQMLGIPPQIVSADSVWPYTLDTLIEVIRYKTEQERTRQEALKHDYTVAALELLRLARSMNITGEALSGLFGDSVESLAAKLDKLRRHEMHEMLAEALPSGLGSDNSSKRRSSDPRHHTQLPSFTETTQSIKPHASRPSSIPTRSPSRLPPLVHRRVKSDTSDQAETKDHDLSTLSQTPRSLGPHQNPAYLQQSLPGPVAQTPKQNRSPQTSNQQAPHQTPQLGPIQSHRSSPGSAYPGYYHLETKPNGRSGTLGSPYNLKYPTIVYSGPFNSQYLPPQQHYQYFVSPPPPPPGAPASGPPPPGHYLVPSMPGQIMPPFAPEDHRREDVEDTSPGHGTKRHRSNNSGKTSSINFMITTPKNPPAKKYNNSKGNT